MYQTEIKFKTLPRKTALTDGKICYQGQLMHNRVLSAVETRRLFAEYMRQNEPQVNMYLDGLGSFMRAYLAEGYRLDFGGFSAELRMRGGFPAANAPFDPKRNAIGVDLKPGPYVKAAVSDLKPINVTVDTKAIIYSVYQMSPFEAYDVVAREGERIAEVVGSMMRIHPDAEDEGIWIENDAGVRLARADIEDNDCCQARIKLTEPVEPGLHWLVACCRYDPASPLLRARRRLTVA